MLRFGLSTLALLIATALPSTLGAQAAAANRGEVLTAARDIMQAARYATLVTIGIDGQPQARIVDPFVAEPDFTVWVGTNALTRKVADIRRDARVTLLYFNAERGEYVTLIGHARLIDDAAEKARRFKDEWTAFYRNGAADESYVLIRIQPVRLEVVSPARGVLNDPKTWRPVIIEF